MKIYRKGTELPIREYNFTLHQGGGGDLISQLPALKYILDNHKNIIMNLWVHSYGVELCQAVFKSYSNCIIGDISKYKGVYKEDLPARSPYVHNISNLAMHLTDHAFLSLVGCDVEPEHKNYIKLDPIDVSHFNLPKRYAVVATGFTSETREWNSESVKETTDYLVSKNIVPVYIGKSYTPSFITENKNEAKKEHLKLITVMA